MSCAGGKGGSIGREDRALWGAGRLLVVLVAGDPQVVSGDSEIRRSETATETLSKIIKAHVN
jgi:hypothetical protein